MAHLGLHDVPLGPTSGVFRTGDVLDGKYRIERVIAEGGVAIVVQAEQLGLDRHVAIKLLRPEMLAHRELVEHFRSEGSLAAKIKSEHVVRIHDVGEGPGIGPYMVMELLEGYDLEQRIQSGALPAAEAVDYVLQACDALAEAHHLRIVHRDLKPANLFLASRPSRAPILKIIDFGISKLVPRPGADGAWTTADRTVAGTPAYMSPEHIRGDAVDARADIWSIGVVLYELVSGVLPFPIDAPSRMLRAICNEAPVPLRAIRPDLPPELEAVIARCLARSPADRFASVEELVAALAPLGSADPLRTSAPLRVVTSPQAVDPRRHAPTVVVTRTERRGHAAAVAIGVAALLAAAGGALVIRAATKKDAPAAAAPLPPAEGTAPSAAPAATSEPAATSDPAETEPAPEAPAPAATARDAATRTRAPSSPRTRPGAATKPATTGAPSASDRSMFGERK